MKRAIFSFWLFFANVLLLPSEGIYISPADLNALQSREQIRDYAMQRSEASLQQIIRLAREGGDVPEEYFFLITQATRITMNRNLPNPQRWDARATLSAFSSAQEVRLVIEAAYRDTIFSLLAQQKRVVALIIAADLDDFQERLGRTLAASYRSAEIEWNDRPVLNFMLDPEGSENFYRFTAANVGKVLAVMLEDRVRSQVTIRTAIRDSVTLTGFGFDETQHIARILNASSLPAILEVVLLNYLL